MNNALVTTGLIPLTIGSTERFVAQAHLDEVPWDLTGGTALLLLRDPANVAYTLTATITVGALGFGVASVAWTVASPAGTWLRAWKITDASGIIQFSRPLVFTVISSPS